MATETIKPVVGIPKALKRHCDKHCGGLKRAKPLYAVSHDTHCPVDLYERLVGEIVVMAGRLKHKGINQIDIMIALQEAMRKAVGSSISER